MAKAQKVLVTVDGSDNAIRALKFALSATPPDSRLFVLYVQAPVPRSRAVSDALIQEHYGRQEEAALKNARKFLTRTKANAKVEVCIGEPAPTILEYARKKKCTQIVMGNHGHGTLAGLFLGSVAMKVVQLSEIPVTLVK
jgi:nucleotide-binding universal stress UspA family protein